MLVAQCCVQAAFEYLQGWTSTAPLFSVLDKSDPPRPSEHLHLGSFKYVGVRVQVNEIIEKRPVSE